MSIDRISVLRAYIGTRRAQVRLRTRLDIEKRQARLWRALAPTIGQTPALKKMAGAALTSFPIVTPRDIRDQFDQWNTLGLTAEAAHAAASKAEHGEAGEVSPGVSAGFSTGTSGSRGFFLASRAERARYLGQTLAKLLPGDALFRRRRIALCLRADSALYRDVKSAGPFEFRFFELVADPDERAREIAAFGPHILVAPSHVLADLGRRAAAGSFGLSGLERLFYGTEPMGDAERDWLTRALESRPEAIYQATEGFLGAACRHGTLHLNEDSLIVERASVPGTNRFQPIVTDLRRTSQPMVRVQLDDLLEPLATPCPCGSALLAVRGVEGRITDLWRWDTIAITPRDVEEAVTTAIGPVAEWRAIASTRGAQFESSAENAESGAAAIANLLRHHGVQILVEPAPLWPMEGFKRQRVRWSNG